MKTAYTATQLAIIRTHPQISQYGLAVHVPQIISEGVLNAVPTIYPGNSLSITNIVAGYTLSKIKRGMTLWLGHEGPRYDLGQLRVRKDYSGNSLIEVAEYGSGLMNYLNGASVTIVEDYRIWPIHPSYDTTASRWRVDIDPYTAQTKSYGPQVIMGPPAVIQFGNNETKVLASYVGDLSLQHSGSITSQTWTFPDGQTVTSALGSSQNPIVITYLNASPDGAVHTLKVTDGGGNSHIGQRLTFAFGSNVANFPIDCKFDVISGGYKQGGYKTRINLGENAPSSTFPDGAKVVLFENASYGTYGSSIGGNYFARDNIVMVGRVVTESQRIEPFTNDLTFEIESEDGELHRSQSYDMFLESGSAASDWSMASGLTVDRAGIVLAKYRSTLANVVDFHPASGIASTGEIPYRDLAAGTLYDQLTYNYQAVGFGVISFDLQGNLWAMLDTQVTGTSSTLPTIMDIGAGDRRDAVQIDHEHRDTNAQYLLYAVESGDYNPVAAWSPGDRQGYFGQRQEISRNLLANSQDTVITWAGNKRAQDNNPYKKVVIPLAGNNRIDPVPQSLITMSLSGTNVPRGYTWTNKNLIPYEISIAYNPDSRYPMIDLTAEAVVNGIGGSAFTYPTVTSIISPPPPPTPAGCPPGYHPDLGTGVCIADGSAATTPDLTYVFANGLLGRSRNFIAGGASVTWENVTGVATGSGTGTAFILDPWGPKAGAYMCWADTLWHTGNLDSSPPTWTSILTASTVQTAKSVSSVVLNSLSGSITENNLVYVAWTSSTKCGVSTSTDSGATWAHHFVQNENGFARRIIADMQIAGKVWFDGANNGYEQVKVSTDYGATWAGVFGPSFTVVSDFDISYPDAAVAVAQDGAGGMWYSHSGGAWTQQAGSLILANGGNINMNIATQDKNDVLFASARVAYHSADGGVNWTSTIIYGGGVSACSNIDFVAVGRWPYDKNKVFWLWCPGGVNPPAELIAYSTDLMVTVQNKMGNWNAVMGAFANPVMIVPCWLS